MLNRERGLYLIKSIQSLLMILPQEQSYHSLHNRLKCLTAVSLPAKKGIIGRREKSEEEKAEIEKCLGFFDKAVGILNEVS